MPSYTKERFYSEFGNRILEVDYDNAEYGDFFIPREDVSKAKRFHKSKHYELVHVADTTRRNEDGEEIWEWITKLRNPTNVYFRSRGWYVIKRLENEIN